MKQKIHFLCTDKGYQFLTSTAYNELENYDRIKAETSEELEEEEINKLFQKPWQEVKEFIKNKIDLTLNK